MELRRFLRVLLGRWLFVVAVVAGCTGVAAALAWTQSPTYEAHTQLFVSANNVSSDPSATYQGGLFSEERVLSYAQIVASPPVLRGVIQQLGLRESTRDLQRQIDTSVPTNTVLLNITVSNNSAGRAAAIAQALTTRFIAFVDGLEHSNGGPSPVKVSVTSPAQVPTGAASPRKPIFLAIGIVLGLLLGIGGALLREALGARIRDEEDLEAAAGAATLGVIGEGRRAARAAPVAGIRPGSRRAQDYLWLRANLRSLIDDRGVRSLVVATPIADGAATAVAANLGIVLAQAGYRVACVEGDFHRPRLASMFGVGCGVGLADVLAADDVPVQSVLQTWREDLPLQVVDRGAKPTNPSDLLGSHRFGDVLEELTASFDLVLISAPPLLEETDGALAARAASGALVVVRAGSTRADEVAAAVHSLDAVNATTIGVVLNSGRGRARPRWRRLRYTGRRSYRGGPATRPLAMSLQNPTDG